MSPRGRGRPQLFGLALGFRAFAGGRAVSGLGLAVALGLQAFAGVRPLMGQERSLDDVATATSWRAIPSDGVEMRLSRENGALRLDFDFKGHGGYAIAHKPINLELPANYEFVFELKGEAPPENLEFKLSDADSANGANVWWLNRRDFRFPREWTTVRTKKRQITFAWGPAGGGEPKRIASLEVVVTAGSGGKGTVWFRDLRLRTLPPPAPVPARPEATASSSAPGSEAARAVDGDTMRGWRSAAGGAQWLALDFGRDREYGGVVLDWGSPPATSYAIEASDDGNRWTTLHDVTRGTGTRDYIPLRDAESRYLRLRLRAGSGSGYSLRELRIQPPAFGDSPDSATALMARESPRGRYPRAYLGRQAYWTIVGVPGEGREALLDTDGRLEPDRGSFSIEPFLYVDGRLLSWADGSSTASLTRGDLPIPSVQRSAAGLALTVTAFALPGATGSELWARYRITNAGREARRATLYLALRPFQVNPPWQFLATQGGAAPVADVSFARGVVTVGRQAVETVTRPDAFGATAMDAGEVVSWLARGRVPPWTSVRDSREQASGALAYGLRLDPGQTRDVFVRLPRRDASPATEKLAVTAADPAAAGSDGNAALAQAEEEWAKSLDRAGIELAGAGAEVARALRTSLAYILLNRDGPALRPGSRSYARSWIRDGALMSAALLRLGHAAEVADYIRWYAPYQFPDGKVPCCVDARGADPVPENDSHGELIYLVAEYFRFTADTALVREVWPHVAAAAAYIGSLRRQRMTAEYMYGEDRLFFGLLPESISHEGYSAKPQHSYWDDLWGLRGMDDAAFLARVLGRDTLAARLAAEAGSFRADIYASMQVSMAKHGVDYVPGSAELGDFDATSTTIGVAPGGELGRLPEPALHNTFERYWREFTQRRDGRREWQNYTPYEWRVVGTFVRLGWRERAVEATRFFMGDRRPAAWNGWAEVVWRDPAAPRFIGDMPHTWVAADFLRSALDMLVYERDADQALVVGAGVPDSWLTGAGVRIRGLRTRHGSLDVQMTRQGDIVRIRLGGDLRVPAGGIVLRPPLASGRRWQAKVDGRDVPVSGEELAVHALSALIEMRSAL